MATVDLDLVLAADQVADPVLWTAKVPADQVGRLASIDTSTEEMEKYLGSGKGMKLKGFGHSSAGVHFLLTRAGTTVHTDKAYTRYSHQLVLRNDGNRIRGLPRYDREQDQWHEPFLPGVMYALDTHSPRQGLHDPRIADAPGLKAVIAVDRDEVLSPEAAWELFRPWVLGAVQLADTAQPDEVLTKVGAPRWRAKK